jgi:hypothetical protein
MAKKQKTTDTLNLESILFNCREYLRSNASLNTEEKNNILSNNGKESNITFN